MILHLIDPDHL